jgi:hypothetical protein
MGCLIVVVMGAVTAAMVYFFGYAEWVLIALGVLWLASIGYSAFAGHWGFGGGGNTDLQIVIAGLGIAAAILIPNYTAGNPCNQAQTALNKLADAEAAYFEAHKSYTADLSLLQLTPASGVQVRIDRADEHMYAASASHPQCLDESGASPRIFKRDLANGGGQP